MDHVSLEAEHRTELRGSALRRLRESGYVPGVLYGGQVNPVPLSILEGSFLQHHMHGSALVELHVGDRTFDALVHAVQRDPISRKITHVDFYQVDLQRPIEMRVPVHVHGIDVVERRGAVVQQQAKSITVLGRPVDVPEYISVDVSHLQVGEHLSAKDIVLPDSVQLRSQPDEVVVTALNGKQPMDADTDNVQTSG